MKNTRKIFSLFILSVFLTLGSLVTSTVQVSAQDCDIFIEKIASPDDDTEFDFTVTGNGDFGFTLSDPSTPAINFSIPLVSVTVLEEVTPGWVLDAVECSDPQGVNINILDNGVTIECLTLAQVTCTFFNSMEEPPPEPAQVPTLSEWGLIAMASILGIVGFMVIRRKKVTV